jgi:TonB-dependent SusC/RagA subfamily outer membrane receptor
MKTKIFLFLLLSVLYVNTLTAQKHNKKITITGYVVDDAQRPVENAIIMINGKNSDYFTDIKGYYKIKVKSNTEKIGIFVFPNRIIEESINGRERINFSLITPGPPQEYDASKDPGEEEINLGYGTVKKKNITSEVGKINGRNRKGAFYNTIYDMIRGRVPGVIVNGRSIRIRGDSSLNLTNEPLFVVDGVSVTSIDNIQPQMVKSIEVLKGASASMYGSRGANGVILINLIRGTETK